MCMEIQTYGKYYSGEKAGAYVPLGFFVVEQAARLAAEEIDELRKIDARE